jgi:hypothetical protein
MLVCTAEAQENEMYQVRERTVDVPNVAVIRRAAR